MRGEIQWNIARVKAPEVWDTFKIDGSGILVGHIDGGVDGTHPLLAGKVLVFNDLNPADGVLKGPVPGSEGYDTSGHGTHTAGTICAGDGLGVAPGARLISARIFGVAEMTTHEIILKAMQWMLDPDGNPETDDRPRIVSCSWGAKSDAGTDPEEVMYFDVVENWVAAGILPVFAAGNAGPMSGKVDYPACFRNSWAVAGIKSNDRLAVYSSPGPATWLGETYVKPDIAAPGKDVISCRTNGGLTSMDGTSVACPHAAGVAALVLQADPTLTPARLREQMEAVAFDLGSPGKDNSYGAGRIDALAAVSRVSGATPVETRFAGLRTAAAQEAAFLRLAPAGGLVAPLAAYLTGRLRALDEGEFRSLTAPGDPDPLVRLIVRQAASVRTFDCLHDPADR